MQIEQLRYFNEIVRQKSINRAAEILYLNQPSLSKSMRALEIELGAPLFVRSTKGIELTDFGKEFFEISKNIIEQVEKAFFLGKKYSLDIDLSKEENLNIYLDDFIKDIFSKNIINYMKLYTNLNLNIKDYNINQIAEALLNDNLDFAIFTSFPGIVERILNETNLCCDIIAESGPWALTNKNTKITNHKSIVREELRSMKVIRGALSHLNPANFKYQASITNNSLCMELLKDEDTILIVPGFSVGYFLTQYENLKALKLKNMKDTQIVCLSRFGIEETPYAKEFIEYVLKSFF